MRAWSARKTVGWVTAAGVLLTVGAAAGLSLAGNKQIDAGPALLPDSEYRLNEIERERWVGLESLDALAGVEPTRMLEAVPRESDALAVSDGALRATGCCFVGAFSNIFTLQSFFVGNIIRVLADATLQNFAAELDFLTPQGQSGTTITYAVYRRECDGLYHPVVINTATHLGTGQGFYFSPDFNITLTPEIDCSGTPTTTFYSLAVGWGPTLIDVARDSAVYDPPQTLCGTGEVGSIWGSWSISGDPPPPGDTNTQPMGPDVRSGVWSHQICFKPPPGACCLPDDSCQLADDQNACDLLGGVFTAADVLCSDVVCPLPDGACCTAPDTCDFQNQFTCEADPAFLSWEEGRNCAPHNPCAAPTGACCMVDGSCVDDMARSTCETQDGIYNGDLSFCADPTVTCTPQGACCLPESGCVVRAESACLAAQGQVYAGDGTHCPGGIFTLDPCDNTTSACCFYDGSCTILTQHDCEFASAAQTPGTWAVGNPPGSGGVACASAACDVLGGCCDPSGPSTTCTDTTSSGCVEFSCVDVVTSGVCPAGFVLDTVGDCVDVGQVGECKQRIRTWYQGQPCQFDPCSAPVGACCVLGKCLILNQFDCEQVYGGVFTATGSNGFAACGGNQLAVKTFPACVTGPGGGVPTGCEAFDLDTDVDVDLADYAIFMRAPFAPNVSVFDCSSNGNLGACCINETCSLTTQSACTAAGGFFNGVGIACTASLCALTACCDAAGLGLCADVYPVQCLNSNGVRAPLGLMCDPDGGPCADGACCVNQQCRFVNELECVASNGLFEGVGAPCTPDPCPDGACCVSGQCSSVNATQCAGLGGVYQGAGVPCSPSPCATGACCALDATCTETTRTLCEADPDNIYQGDTTTCGVGICTARGACCVDVPPFGLKCTLQTQGQCDSLNGFFGGPGTSCIQNACDQGACCLLDGSCVDNTRVECGATADAIFDDLNSCGTVTCPTRGACCLGSGPSFTCQVLESTACTNGIYRGDGVSCDAQACTQVACCMPAGDCQDLFGTDCTSNGGTPGVLGQNCAFGDYCTDGACCVDFAGNLTCFDGLNQLQCQVAAGEFGGPGSVCSPTACDQGACCHRDGTCDDNVTAIACAAFGGSVFTFAGTCSAIVCTDICAAFPNALDDFDDDGDIDLRDFGAFQICFGNAPTDECACIFDQNEDGVLDLFDFAKLQSLFVGPLSP